MFNHASGQLLPEHTWNPRCAQNFSWTHVQQDIKASAAQAHAKSPPLGSPSAHKAQRVVHATRLLRSHAKSTLGSLSVRKGTCSREKDCCVLTPHLDLFPCANRHLHATTLLHSHAVSTFGSLSVRREACSGKRNCCVLTPGVDNTAAFARCEQTWISLRAQRSMLHRKDCCVLTPSTLGSRSVRKETCSGEKNVLRSHAGSGQHCCVRTL